MRQLNGEAINIDNRGAVTTIPAINSSQKNVERMPNQSLYKSLLPLQSGTDEMCQVVVNRHIHGFGIMLHDVFTLAGTH